MRRFRFCALAWVLLAAVALAACSGSEPNVLSIAGLRDAAANSQAAGSVRFRVEMTMRVAGQEVTVDGSGVSSADGSRLAMRLGFSGPAALPDDLAIEARVVDNAMYMDFSALATLTGTRLPSGKRWVRIGFDDVADATGMDLGALLEQARQSSPTSGLQFLSGLSGDLRIVGHDTIAGREATHYRAEIDFAKALDQRDLDVPQEMRDAFAAMGPSPADVWVDDDDRVVKMRYRMDGAALGGAGSIEITFEILEFGVAVDVEAPPAEQVVGITELMANAGGITA